ncbi:hypothetical protein EON65_37990 [archaeon]|nr:MAG: hypothetical protein EON65_37990 [archaeon]
MSFNREVPELKILVLKLIANQPLKCVTEAGCHKLLDAIARGCFADQDIVQTIVKYITETGRMNDDAVPPFLFNQRSSISLRNSKISCTSLSCPHLCAHLYLTIRLHVFFYIGRYLIKAISQSRDTLQTLDVSGCFQVDASIMEEVLMTCRNIKNLNLRSCRKLTNPFLDTLVKNRAIKLESLDIGGDYNITDLGVQAFLSSYHNISNLKELNLSGLVLTDDTILLVVKQCSSLVSLGVGYLDLKEATYMEVFRTLGPQLVHINISWSSSVMPSRCLQPKAEFLVDCLVSLCPVLREVDLSGNKNIILQSITDLIDRKSALLMDTMNDNAVQLESIIVKFVGSAKATMERLKDMNPTYSSIRFVF